MDKKKLNLLFILFCVLLCMVLAGCKDQSIKFYRESKAQSLMNSIKNPQSGTFSTRKSGETRGTYKKSSGVVIYKDNSTTNSTGYSNVNFGPGDVNFDLPTRF